MSDCMIFKNSVNPISDCHFEGNILCCRAMLSCFAFQQNISPADLDIDLIPNVRLLDRYHITGQPRIPTGKDWF